MRKRIVIGVSSGVVVLLLAGGGAWWWFQMRPNEEPVVNSKGGKVALDTSTPKPAASGELAVGESNGSMQGMSVGGSSASGSGGSAAGGGGSASGGSGGGSGSSGASGGAVPTAKELEEAKKYVDSKEVHFIDYAPGAGSEAKGGQRMVVNYRGWLTDGRKFDDSYIKGQPFIFVAGEHKVIPGFEAGVIGMKVGGRRRLIIPPAGGYGAAGKDPVPPNSVLIFDLELVAAQDE